MQRFGLISTAALVTLISCQIEAQNPNSCLYFTSFEDYELSWYEDYPGYAYSNMYPFGPTFCDTNATSGGKSIGFNPGSTFAMPFYGTTYHSMWISPNGYILLNETVNFQTPPFSYMQLEWPNENYPINGAVDPPFLSPFYAYIDYRLGQQYEPSQISYRVLDPQATGLSAQQQNIQAGMLAQISQDVQAAVPGAMSFSAQWGVVVTYYNVTFYTNNPCTTGPNLYDTCLRNTFQVVFVTDGVTSYSVYNYFNITWVGSQALQNCDPNTGQNSTAYPNCQPAQIGFNAGFGRGFTSLPYSNTAEEVHMDSLSGTNVTGRWIYQVSGDIGRHGGCTTDSSLANTGTWPLTISPAFGPMFGGNVVNVSGPCINPASSAAALCRFGNTVTPAYYWGNTMQVTCIQPVLYEVGPITLSVSTDGGSTFPFNTTYNVFQQETVPELGVQVLNFNGDWLNPTTMTLTWNPDLLQSALGNGVNIELLGYTENQPWQVIYTFGSQDVDSGTFTFSYNSQMCLAQNSAAVCTQYNLGAFRVSLSNWPDADANNLMAVWSAPVPLGWFMQAAVIQSQGASWAGNSCDSWYSTDIQTTSWEIDLYPCPCTLSECYVDFGHFVQSTDCNLYNYNKLGGCPRNSGAVACFESTNVTSYGSNTRCCYDVYGNLMYTGDAVNGSISQRSDPWGNYPYNTSPNIPSISNWENDLLPYYYCCIWQDDPYDCFNQYMDVRPTQDCTAYNVPGHATAFGDPHFVTMDGTLYTFNGWGEFWLLDITNAQVGGGAVTFALQGRFQQPFNQSWGQIKATVMTAVAMQLNSGPIVTVMTNLYSEKERMLVYVDNALLNFSTPSQYWQQFPDFIVMSNDPSCSYNNFSVIFRIGIGINIGWANGVMEMYATIPAEFMRTTGGLFGYWNGNAEDDLMPRGSTSTPISPTDSQSLYTSFGMTWIVQPTETIFTYAYRASLNYNYYRNTWFTPTFVAAIPPNGTVTQAQVNAVCGSDTSCQYDYMITENETVALDTHAVTLWDAQLRTMGAFVTSCGWLDIPDSVRLEPTSYLVGSTVTILGCMEGFQMESIYMETYQLNYVCQSIGPETAAWIPSVSISCVQSPTEPPTSDQPSTETMPPTQTTTQTTTQPTTQPPRRFDLDELIELGVIEELRHRYHQREEATTTPTVSHTTMSHGKGQTVTATCSCNCDCGN